MRVRMFKHYFSLCKGYLVIDRIVSPQFRRTVYVRRLG